jgi:hypothetical protein
MQQLQSPPMLQLRSDSQQQLLDSSRIAAAACRTMALRRVMMSAEQSLRWGSCMLMSRAFKYSTACFVHFLDGRLRHGASAATQQAGRIQAALAENTQVAPAA